MLFFEDGFWEKSANF